MTGAVNASGEAVLSLEMQSPSGAGETVEAVLDTGFTGYLTLPRALVDSLSLPLLSFTPVMLADGSTVTLDVHDALVIWHGRQRAVECLVADSTPLVGISLLHGSVLRVQVVAGGAVEIEELP